MAIGTTLALIGVGAKVLGGLFGGWAASRAKRKALEAKRNEINNAIKKGDDDLADYIEQLDNSYDIAMNSLEDSRQQTATALGYTQTQRSSDAATNSMLNTRQSELEYQQLAQILSSNEKSVGSAVQQASQTGFRNTGSNANNIEDAERQAEYAASQALGQIQLSSAQRFASASSNYFSQTANIESYQQNLETIARKKTENTNTYNLNKTQATDKWNQQKALYEKMLKSDDLNYTTADGFSDFLGTLTNTFSTFADYDLKK